MSNYAAMEGDRPGWVKLFESQLKEDPSAKSYPFSSVANDAPKVRYVVHRSLSPASNFFTFTTDIRMHKVSELKKNPKVEAAFWMEKTGVQFRVSGKAAVLPHEDDKKEETSKILKELLQASGEEADAEYWKKRRSEEFEGMSGHLRASFARPTPATPLSEVDENPEDWPETIKPPGKDDKTKAQLEMADKNLHLVAISPETIDMLELKEVPNKRTIWTRQAPGKWSVVSVCP